MRVINLLIILFVFPVIALANSGPYIQTQLGKFSEVELVVFDDRSPVGIGGRISMGYLFGEGRINYGLEAGALSYPNLKSEHSCDFFGYNCHDTKVQGNGLDVLGVLKYSFDSGVTLFGKAGYVYSRQKFKYTYTNNDVKTSSMDSVRPEVAFGVGYQFNRNLEITLTPTVLCTPHQPITALYLGLSFSL